MREDMFFGATPIIFELAKKLRNNVTPTEMILWGKLKEFFPEIKFRRQHPISLYIADFYCHSKKLIVEIHGSIHNDQSIQENDKIRQEHLETLEIKVIRFTTSEVLNKLDFVLREIGRNIN